MIKSDFITLLKLKLGNRTDAYVDSLIPLEADLVQTTTLEQDATLLPWFLETGWVTLVVTAGNEIVPLPSDFLQEQEDEVLQIQVNNVWTPLEKVDYDEAIGYYGNVPATPRAYAMNGNSFIFITPPDIAYPARFKYLASDAVFSSLAVNAENKWLKNAPDLFLSAVGGVIAMQHLRDNELGQVFSGMFSAAMTRLRTQNESRQHVNRNYRSKL